MNQLEIKQHWNEILGTRAFTEIIGTTSSSEDDLKNRVKVYSEVMDKLGDVVDTYKMFSGYSEMPLLGLQQINASLTSYIRSFAGYLTIERSMEQPTALLWYDDVLGVTDNRIVTPNLGKDNLDGINSKFSTRSPLVDAQKEYSISTNKKLIPGSIEIVVILSKDASPVSIKDDRKGNLLAPAGFLSKGSVNYSTGVLTFEVTGDTKATGSYSIVGAEDVAGDPAFGQLTGPGNNRFKFQHRNIMATATPDMLIGETDLMTAASAKKSIGFDLNEAMGKKLTELYTKLINKKLVEELVNSYQGDTYEVDMASFIGKFTDYNSRLDAFSSETVNIDTLLATKTYKATYATAYVVGEKVGNLFRKMSSVGLFVDNTDSTYVNDLLGTYKGRPVLRCIDLKPDEAYAIHKTPGGELAPLIRGIHLPLTSTPVAMNYNNTAQMARGVFYQEANESIVPELVQKFTIRE